MYFVPSPLLLRRVELLVCLIPDFKKCPGFVAPWAGVEAQRAHASDRRGENEAAARTLPSRRGLPRLAVCSGPARSAAAGTKATGPRLQGGPSGRCRAGPQSPGLGTESWSLLASLDKMNLLELAA